MDLTFHGKRISGMAVVVPERERTFADDMANFNFSPARSRKLAMVMGYDRHRVVEEGVCSSDLAVYAFEQLVAEHLLDLQTIDALVFLTVTPDYPMPPTSRIIHGRLGLRQDVICLDLVQGCSAFEEGLVQAFMLLEQPAIHKVAVVTSDVLSRKVSAKDRNSYPLIGDAATVTIVEKDASSSIPIVAFMKNDGSRALSLRIPAGGLRLPHSAATAEMKEDAEGNFRSDDNLIMQGQDVFNFVMADVPKDLEELIVRSGKSKDEIDAYLFHQPNRFMLQKLAEKLGVPAEKMPANVVERWGNSSGGTVPAATVLNYAERLCKETLTVFFAGFGVGLSWAGMIMNCGPLDFCRVFEYPNHS
ncbi:MAG: ketoacyl-ACP synthase III [Kiritimatiellia bacterium]